jgi:hypothetical protein
MIFSMRELLFFPENLSQPLQWATLNADGQLALHDPIRISEIGALKAVNKKGVTLILPGQRVASYRFAMPKVTGQAKQQAIAFALEGVCSQPLEDLYVISGDYVDGKQSAMVIDRDYLDHVLQVTKANHLKVVAIFVDYMLLKKPALSSWVATCSGKDVLWRTDQGTGGRVEAALWPFIIEQMFDQAKRVPKSIVWTLAAGNPKPPALPDDCIVRCEENFQEVPSWLNQASLNESSHYQFNLGSNKLRSLFNKRKRSLGLTVKVFISVLIFSLLSQIAFTAFVQIKLNKESSVLNRWLKPMGLGQMPLGEIKMRLKAAIESAEKVQAADGFSYSVSAMAHALTAQQKNLLIGLRYDANIGLTLEFPKKNISQVMQSLKKSMPTYQVTIQSPKKPKSLSAGYIVIKRAAL